MKSGLNQYFEEVLLSPTTKRVQQNTTNKINTNKNKSNKITLSQYFEKELLQEKTTAECLQETSENRKRFYEERNSEKDEEIDIYSSYASYMSSSGPGSDNLLVTFDYGFQDSWNGDLSINSENDSDRNKNLFRIAEEETSEDLLAPMNDELHLNTKHIYKVHRVQNVESDGNIKSRAGSCISMATSLVEYNIDTSGDYGSWAQSESEEEPVEKNRKTYRYEDLIKTEVLTHEDDDGNDDREVLINFNFDEDIPPRWFNDNEHLYYRSLDYLN